MSERVAIRNAYAGWLIGMAEEWCGPQYSALLRKFHSTPFRAILERDENRISDGKELRARFVEQSDKYTYQDMYLYLEECPCSILELILALIIRCDEQIMWDPDAEPQGGKWFADILTSLELNNMTNENYDPDYVEFVLDRFVNRNYAPNGRGGLFIIHYRDDDIREVEIWYQMMWYLNELIDQ